VTEYPALPKIDVASSLPAGFADFLTRLATKLGAPPEAAAAAGEAGRSCLLALAAGHVCADLHALAAARKTSAAGIRGLLLNSGVVTGGNGEAPLPLVLDDRERLYLYRYFAYERQLAAAILTRAAAPPPPPLPAEVERFLASRFAANAAGLAGRPDRQRLAVTHALANPLTIISGGPGTGKTTIVTTLIAALAMQDPPPRIALAAPTGKAAARMEAAIGKSLATLAPALISRLPSRATTVHLLLGARPESADFIYNPANPLPCDVIIVDEASMLDLSLAARLFAALTPEARIVLLGDKDQLAAVEAGAVFAALAGKTVFPEALAEPPEGKTATDAATAALSAAQSSGLPGCVVWLRENYRFGADSPLGRLAALVAAGDGRRLTAWLQEQKDESIKWVPIGEGLPARIVEALVTGFAPYAEAVRSGEPRAALRAYENFCVLCALRHGSRGVTGINDAVTQRLRPQLSGEPGRDPRWYPGRPIMVTENDYDLGIFNGDIGITLPGKDGRLEVWFNDREGSIRFIPPAALPPHQTAFAVTVHKAQGSEFANAALVLPEVDLPVLTRELIYTAVTRVRERLAIYGRLEIMAAAVSRPTSRRSGLAEKLAPAVAGKT